MPVITSSAYVTVETVLMRARAILDDAAIPQGDLLTDDYAGVFSLVNSAYERIQVELAASGVETMKNYAWLIGLPAMPTIDPEARIIVTDNGTLIIYPGTGLGDLSFSEPLLPADLLVPLRLWERQTATQNYRSEMKEPNGGLLSLVQQLFLIDWEWGSYQSGDALMFRGAQQVQDVKIEYEKILAQVSAVTDPLPMRGVTNAAAYQVAKMFTAGRGGEMADGFGKEGEAEIQLIIDKNSRKRQRKRQRRVPYSGRGFRTGLGQTW